MSFPIFLYIYMCVCVCVCIYICQYIQYDSLVSIKGLILAKGILTFIAFIWSLYSVSSGQ